MYSNSLQQNGRALLEPSGSGKAGGSKETSTIVSSVVISSDDNHILLHAIFHDTRGKYNII